MTVRNRFDMRHFLLLSFSFPILFSPLSFDPFALCVWKPPLLVTPLVELPKHGKQGRKSSSR